MRSSFFEERPMCTMGRARNARGFGGAQTMYQTHFGLRQWPFRAIPDSECYYPATSHEQALTQLLQAIHDEESLALLTGEPGTGKTLLCHCLLDRLGDKATSAFLTNTHFGNRTGLLQALLYDLSLPYEGRGEQELRLALTDFLLKNYAEGRRTVFVLDEAQHLTPDLLEELRLLSNLEGRQGKAVQVVLLALPAIAEDLRLPELAAFSQRLAVHAQLEPLGLHEAADYVVHHLRAAGGQSERIIADEALGILARATHGVPRLLNRGMHQALTLAYAAEAALVDAEAVLEALTQLGLREGGSRESVESSVNAGEVQVDLAAEETAAAPTLRAEETDDKQDSPLPRDSGRSRRLFAPPRRPA
jgi:type II secretory pathway predicted ATPase ExeA